MNTTYQRLAIALLILIGGWLVFQFPTPVIQIGTATVQIEIVDTDELRTQGLSGRKQLGENQGMLFVFEKPGRYGFWMKEMNFPIDIIWIGQDKNVIEIIHSVGPETFPEVFYPSGFVQYVLEISA